MSTLYGNAKLTATIVSDTHIDIQRNVRAIPMYLLIRSLEDAKKNNSDAFINVGDTTSRGCKENWTLTRKCFEKVPDVAKKIILAIGNHDGWHDNGFDAAIKEYYSAYEDICSRKITTPYFSEDINGYKFICIGTDSESGCEAALSEKQIQWFENEMEEASLSGKPIFVFCHQSINQKHGLPRTCNKVDRFDRPPEEGGMGEDSDTIEKIVKKYKNVFFFSGHSHMGLCGEDMKAAEGYSSFEYEDGVTLINLPSLSCNNHHGELKKLGIGLQLEIYDNKVVLRPKNFISGKFIDSINIKDKKPYYELILE